MHIKCLHYFQLDFFLFHTKWWGYLIQSKNIAILDYFIISGTHQVQWDDNRRRPEHRLQSEPFGPLRKTSGCRTSGWPGTRSRDQPSCRRMEGGRSFEPWNVRLKTLLQLLSLIRTSCRLLQNPRGLQQCRDRKFPISLQKCNWLSQVTEDLQHSVRQPLGRNRCTLPTWPLIITFKS